MADVIGVILLTGFLGAGKTTLLNGILRDRDSRRFGVVINEFGAIGIDQDLVLATDDGLIELANGCLCCSVADDFVDALEKLRRSGREFDGIIVETTGLADPGPVLRRFLTHPTLALNYRLDSVVTVVDAHHNAAESVKSPEIRNQIGFADVLLLNKCDDMTEVALAKTEAALRAQNPLAAIYRTQHCDLPLATILQRRPADAQLDDHGAPHQHAEGEGHHHGEGEALHHGDEAHHHADDVIAVSLLVDGDLDQERFLEWIGGIIAQKGEELLRLKGILAFGGEPRRFVLQSVQGEVDGAFDRAWLETEKRQSRLVLIGRGLDESGLRAGIREFQAGVSSAVHA